MIEQLFSHPATIDRYRVSPFAAERELYLSQLINEGCSPKTFDGIFFTMTAIERHLQLDLPRITLDQIEAAAEAWALTTHRSTKCRHIGKCFFVFHATRLDASARPLA